MRKKGHVRPSSSRACRKAVIVRSARVLRDWLRMAAFSRSINPNRPSWREGRGGREKGKETNKISPVVLETVTVLGLPHVTVCS